MTILFLVALLFAIPTYGLSLLVYFGLVLFAAHVRAKERMHHANSVRADREWAQEEQPTMPSWFRNASKVETFEYAVINVVRRNGVPDHFVVAAFTNEQAHMSLMSYAAQLERQGSSFIEQQMGVADKIQEMWRRYRLTNQ
ncbi:hypothetical protein IMZ29_08275 [Achromobacter sp. GG226]|uniref:hypothetical protein n=1 Tax=Verticiella alkaliphila TaxID=2779529 RepID=UPI001C0B581A|nr:hypothetical protein [Verticiella sp. GG226]MBU4610534.1 hypothetical protein [Verticiella sp. GG226]